MLGSLGGLVLLAAIGSCAAAPKPHIVVLLVDDFGWADVGFHRDPDFKEIQTPNFDSLVAEGVLFNQSYVFKYCSPTRCAIQTGRNPIHVNVINSDFQQWNPNDPIGGYQGIPRNMTGIASKLAEAGYATHQVGKWNAGMATWDHTPQGRGYNTSLGYFDYANDYWTEQSGACNQQPIVDMWDTNRPAVGMNDSWACSQNNQEGCKYEDAVFRDRALDIIANHDPSVPLFLFWSPHNLHAPLEVPEYYAQKFSFIDNQYRAYYAAMVNFLDDTLGNVTAALKAKGMWENTLFISSADNGGPIYNNGTSGANNWPLRGGKMSNWQGGIRVNAWASGGFLPESVRGTVVEGYITVWDYYATFAGLAGVDPTDERAAKAGLPPIDSFDMWPMISGANLTSPRTEIALGHGGPVEGDMPNVGNTTVQGLISGPWKLLIGKIGQNIWQGPLYPNATTAWDNIYYECGDPSTGTGPGCLFNIVDDPTEHNDLATSRPDIVKQLRARIAEIQATVYSPHRGPVSPKACKMATETYEGYWGPFVE